MPLNIVFSRPQNWSSTKTLLLKHYYRRQGNPSNFSPPFRAGGPKWGLYRATRTATIGQASHQTSRAHDVTTGRDMFADLTLRNASLVGISDPTKPWWHGRFATRFVRTDSRESETRQNLGGTGDSQRDSREPIRANHWQLKCLFFIAFYSASGRFARIIGISDSRESCESIRATKDKTYLATPHRHPPGAFQPPPHASSSNKLGNGSGILFREYCFREENSLSLTEFYGKLGEFSEKLGEFALHTNNRLRGTQ